MSRNYRKEYDNYHSRPEQKIRRAARNAARAKFKDADSNKDVHHKDNNPLNNDKNNLSLVTQHYNRREPRLRKEDAISRAKERAALKKKHAAEKEAEKIAVKRASEEIEEGKKTFRQTDGIGKAKYTVSYHDGKKKHKDGSDFFDMEIFKNKPSLEKFKKDLLKKGYKAESIQESFSRSLVNKAIKLVKSPKYFQGNYTGAVKAIEKLKKGLSDDSRVLAALRTANEHHKKKGMHTHSEGVDGDAMIDLMQKYLNTKNKGEKKTLLKQINRYQKKLGLKVTEELDANATVGDYISDFSKSDAPQFKGKSAKKVRSMAIAAFNANK